MAKKNDLPPDDNDKNDDLPDDFFDGDDDRDDDENEEGGFADEFFDELNESDFDEEEFQREQKERDDKIKNHPVYKQAWEILHLTEALVASMQPMHEGESREDMMSGTLMESAYILAPKIAGAIGSEDYTYAMQNAALIRHHAEYLRLCTNTLHHFVKVDKKHCKLHRAEMEKFRKLFCEFMNEVKKYDKLGEDEWNVF